MAHKINRPKPDPNFVTPTDAELLDGLDEVRLWARAISDKMKPTPGGDAYEYRGGMNEVEHLREAIDQYEGLFFRVKPTVGARP